MEQTRRTIPSESGREILRVMAKTIPGLSDYRKGYLLGYGEAMLDQERAEAEKQETARPDFAEGK